MMRPPLPGRFFREPRHLTPTLPAMSKHRRDPESRVRLPAILAIGFTGHRILPDESMGRRLIRGFLEERKAATAGIVCGVSSAAAGADLLFAESCLEFGIPLRVLLPMPRERFREDFDASTWERTERVLEAATSVEVAGDHEQRRDGYYECGIRTVQQSQLLLTLWNGQDSRGMGGTADIVEFERAIGRPVVSFHSGSGEQEIFNREAMTEMLTDPELDFLNGLPDAATNSPPDGEEALAREWLRKMDANASRPAPPSRKLASVPVIYTAAAALFSGIATRSPGGRTWMAISVVLAIIAAFLPRILRLDRWQMRWARTRTAAEVGRARAKHDYPAYPRCTAAAHEDAGGLRLQQSAADRAHAHP